MNSLLAFDPKSSTFAEDVHNLSPSQAWLQLCTIRGADDLSPTALLPDFFYEQNQARLKFCD